MNLLSIGAAFGLTVLVFQHGFGEDLLGFTNIGYIQSWTPLTLLMLLFGLSMDYEVFMVSRIREEWEKTGDTTEAIAAGLQHTGGVVTAAAAIMVAIFASFLLVSIPEMKQLGLASPSRYSWTRPSSERCWYPRSCASPASGTGGCQGDWNGCCPGSSIDGWGTMMRSAEATRQLAPFGATAGGACWSCRSDAQRLCRPSTARRRWSPEHHTARSSPVPIRAPGLRHQRSRLWPRRRSPMPSSWRSRHHGYVIRSSGSAISSHWTGS